MSVLDLEQIVTDVRARWQTMVPRKDDQASLNSWDPPSLVPNLGIVTRLSVMHSETYKSSTAEVLIVPFARLGEAAVVLDEFNGKLDALTKEGIVRLLDKPLAEWCPAHGISLAGYQEGMFDHDDAASERRQRALDWANERFPAVAERMKDVYGFILPNYMITFAAFWRSLDDFEKLGAEHLGRRPGGIMVWFEETGLSRKTRDNLDPRLECRFRSDPPELVTIMWGDSDGLHYGLWYDDPADPPTYIAHNYARDSAETWRDAEPTPLGVLLKRADERIIDEYRNDPPTLCVYAIRAALQWFVNADAEALKKAPPAKRWLDADRIQTLGTFGPALPPGAGSIRVGNPHERLEAWKKMPARVRKWIESAKRDCAAGKPAAALTFGLDLHWLDSDEYRKEGEELLLMAYEKLGRRAMAETLKVHYAHRDLPSVGVFLAGDETSE